MLCSTYRWKQTFVARKLRVNHSNGCITERSQVAPTCKNLLEMFQHIFFSFLNRSIFHFLVLPFLTLFSAISQQSGQIRKQFVIALNNEPWECQGFGTMKKANGRGRKWSVKAKQNNTIVSEITLKKCCHNEFSFKWWMNKISKSPLLMLKAGQ